MWTWSSGSGPVTRSMRSGKWSTGRLSPFWGSSRRFALLWHGPPPIAPEMLLQTFCSIRSQRQLMERMECGLLFRWFVVLGLNATF